MDGLLAELKITTHTLKTKSILGSFDRGQHLPEGHTTDPMNHFDICTYNPKKIELSWNMFDFLWFTTGEPTFFYWHLKRWASPKSWKIWLIKGRRGCSKYHRPSHEIFYFYENLAQPASHFLHVQVMWLPVRVRHVGGFNTSACLNHYRNDEGGVVMLQYIISVVFLYLKYIFMIFFSFFCISQQKDN